MIFLRLIMVREIIISIYLAVFSLLFRLFKIFPLQKKIVFVVTFIENGAYIYDEIRRQEPSCRTIFLANKRVYPFFLKYDDSLVLKFNPRHVRHFISSIFHLATGKMIVIDNYYGFLSSIKFRKNVTCLQVWHATGAIKQFGLKDPSIKNRSRKAIKRFKRVYKHFDKIIVGSEKMASFFKTAFNLDDGHILRIGIPRTDAFYDKEGIQLIKQHMHLKFPFLSSKKVILYAPTYRDNQLNAYQLNLDLHKMQKELSNEYVLLLRLHPAIRGTINVSQFEGFVYDFSNYNKLNDILFITDVLISDYSSIPFDFSILERPMIFYPYDLKEYQATRGFWEDYSSMVPGPIVYSTKEIIDTIKSNNFNLNSIKIFKEQWNKFSNGNSSRTVANMIIMNLKSKNIDSSKKIQSQRSFN